MTLKSPPDLSVIYIFLANFQLFAYNLSPLLFALSFSKSTQERSPKIILLA